MAPTLHSQRWSPLLGRLLPGIREPRGTHGCIQIPPPSQRGTRGHPHSLHLDSRSRCHRFSALGPSVSGEPQGASGPQLGSWDHGARCTPTLQSWDRAQIPSDMQNVLKSCHCLSSSLSPIPGQLIDAFELWCWRRLLRVPWTARKSNQTS